MTAKTYKEIITNDVFDICARIREIDPAYFIAYNKRLCRFEVHNRRQRETLALVLPFKTLDARAVSLTLMTRRENIDRLAAEMEASNKRLEESSDRKVMDNARGRLEEELSKTKD